MPDGDEELEPGSEEEEDLEFLEANKDAEQLTDEEQREIKESMEQRRRSGEPMPDVDSVS
jgi:hypothetical protein